MPDGTNVIQKTLIWNPTLANLTLMALGSSAPEIILNVYETLITLGERPGELGASTIVGSAAFNFLVISGVSIYAVSPDNDERDINEREEDGTPLGVKKIYDLGVFSITCFFAVFAYLWIFWCLRDYEVDPTEAYITLGLFFALIIVATAVDKINAARRKKKMNEKFGDAPSDKSLKEPKSTTKYTPLEFYQLLLPLEMGRPIKAEELSKA